ncbi:MAG: SUF system NifU family Fe-S cluster assembly protein [Verrucomicrobiales bacterium]|nr:SUF system NifU family Fe-S cluster assembly protein [Verrucomicrobiales bacterium]
MNEALDELYQQVLLDHSRRPRNYGPLPVPPAIRAEGFNPSCGDEITVWVEFGGGGQLDKVHFQGQGCAISQAAASIMTGKVRGKSRAEAEVLIQAFQEVLTGESQPDFDTLGDLSLFAGVRKFPQRVKCAMLAWRALEQALAGGGEQHL